ncbi:MAG: gliding motility-associated-like protein [Crocinitomix sp.]
MKDNLNIEELFQDKFSSFEGEVSPDAWANIQQGMAAGAAGTTAVTGMSLLMKGVIAGGIVAATVTSVYLFSDSTKQEITPEDNLVVNNQVDNGTNNIVVDQPLQGEDLPNNTIDGLNVSVDNVTDQTNTETVSDVSDDGVIDNSGVVPNNVVVSDPQTDNVSTNGGNENGGTPNVAPDRVVIPSPINDPTPGTIDKDPIVEKQISSDLIIEPGNEFAPTTYAFHANSQNAESVEWLFEDGTVLNGDDVEYTFEKAGTYQVEMLVHGKGQLDSKTIEVIIKSSSSINTLPNIITPNGDRTNDFFAISTTDIETFEIKITDLQGRVLFESTDVNFRWYGTNLGGEELPAGNYIYSFFARGVDGTEFKKADQIKIKIE